MRKSTRFIAWVYLFLYVAEAIARSRPLLHGRAPEWPYLVLALLTVGAWIGLIRGFASARRSAIGFCASYALIMILDTRHSAPFDLTLLYMTAVVVGVYALIPILFLAFDPPSRWQR